MRAFDTSRCTYCLHKFEKVRLEAGRTYEPVRRQRLKATVQAAPPAALSQRCSISEQEPLQAGRGVCASAAGCAATAATAAKRAVRIVFFMVTPSFCNDGDASIDAGTARVFLFAVFVQLPVQDICD